MRKILLYCFLFVISSSAFSQSLSISSDTLELSYNSVLEWHDNKSFLYNNSLDTTEVKWSVSALSGPAAWRLNFCYGGNAGVCVEVNAIGDSGTFRIPEGDSIEIKGSIEINRVNEGFGEIGLEFEDNNMVSAPKLTSYFFLDLVETSVNDVRDLNVNVFPNPMNERLTVEGLENFTGSVELYDVLGKQVNAVSVKGQTGVVLNTQRLKPGIYLLRIFDKAAQEVYAMPVQRSGR